MTTTRDPYDCTGKIGPLLPQSANDVEWPMYSFDRPSMILWNAIAANLHKRGWSDSKSGNGWPRRKRDGHWTAPLAMN